MNVETGLTLYNGWPNFTLLVAALIVLFEEELADEPAEPEEPPKEPVEEVPPMLDCPLLLVVPERPNDCGL